MYWRRTSWRYDICRFLELCGEPFHPPVEAPLHGLALSCRGDQRIGGSSSSLIAFTTDCPAGRMRGRCSTATIEVASGLALVLGFLTREFPLLLVLFNLSAAVIGHPYWSIVGDPNARWAAIHRLLEGHRSGRRRALPPCARCGPSQPGPKASNMTKESRSGTRGSRASVLAAATGCPVMARVPVGVPDMRGGHSRFTLPMSIRRYRCAHPGYGASPKSRNTMSGALVLWRDGRRRPARNSVTEVAVEIHHRSGREGAGAGREPGGLRGVGVGVGDEHRAQRRERQRRRDGGVEARRDLDMLLVDCLDLQGRGATAAPKRGGRSASPGRTRSP